ncbi:hypothetical protein E2C01_044465 [Portunus trituberculatus]|uniref:Uncharacterized protein n=1 Tax=Portunus trituberculatus TaxID=210409 RepID=A0A5B7FYJ2_PORTR|nr:hypothetical protein [Portunus trituberculatus]
MEVLVRAGRSGDEDEGRHYYTDAACLPAYLPSCLPVLGPLLMLLLLLLLGFIASMFRSTPSAL